MISVFFVVTEFTRFLCISCACHFVLCEPLFAVVDLLRVSFRVLIDSLEAALGATCRTQ